MFWKDGDIQVCFLDVHISQKVSMVKGGDERDGEFHVDFLGSNEDIENFET